MSPSRKLALLLSCVAVVGSGDPLIARGKTTRATAARVQSDLPADPAIHFGTLPNGMRYALRRNVSSAGKVAVRLRINAGSLVERDDEYGLAHFVEHMVFRGTTNMPGNTALQRLQQEGLVFGTSIQALTGPTDTNYKLDLPRGAKSLDVALQVLREQVSNASMEPAAIDAERPVIEGEQRSKNNAFINSENARLKLVAPRLGARMPPLGDMNIVRTVGRDRLMKFYHAYYRPTRAILVIDGDIGVDQVEAQVRRYFADWQANGPDGPDADRQEAPRSRPTANVTVTPDDEPVLNLFWIQPPDRSSDSRAKRRRALLRSLGVMVLSERLTTLSRAEGAPVSSVTVVQKDEYGAAESYWLRATYKAEQLDAAIAAFEQAPRQLLRYGINKDELRKAIDRKRAELEEWRASSSDNNADAIVTALGKGDVPTTSAANLALLDEAVEGLSPNEVTLALRPVFERHNPLVVVSSPAAIHGGEAGVLAKLAAAGRQPVSPPVKQSVVTWPYTDFGKSGTVVSRRAISGIDTTVVTFANGTILSIKPMKSRAGEIQINVSGGLGEEGIAADQIDPQLAAMALLRGGVAKLTSEQLAQALEDHRVVGFPSVEEGGFQWLGSTRPSDLQLQMQLLTAYATDPGLRPELLRELQAAQAAARANPTASTPQTALAAAVRRLARAGESSVQSASSPALSSSDLGARLREAIGHGPFSVAMVGDITLDQAIGATASTFGALPPPPSKQAPRPRSKAGSRWPFPGGGPVVQVSHSGDATKALAYVTWPAPSPSADPREFRRAQLLAQLFQLRVIDVIRTREGLAYAPGVTLTPLNGGWSQLAAFAETTPVNTAAFHDAISRIVRDLQNGPIPADELERARGPLIEQARSQRTNPRYWLGVLKNVGGGPDPVNDLEAEIADLQAITPREVESIARKYLRPETAWRASVTAAGSQDSSADHPRQ